MAIPSKNVLGNPNVTEGNFQIAIEQLRESVIGSGKTYDSANTYMQYDTCVYNGITYYSRINSNTGNTPSASVTWGLIGDLFNLLITNGTVLGYGTGSGGTVTQLTRKSTAVTLNKPCGIIIMNSEELAAGATVFFQVNNSIVTPLGDTVQVCGLWSVVDPINYRIESTRIAGGSFTIKVTNVSAGSLSEAIVITFSIIKGAIA